MFSLDLPIGTLVLFPNNLYAPLFNICLLTEKFFQFIFLILARIYFNKVVIVSFLNHGLTSITAVYITFHVPHNCEV